jgi:hypothetical protein
MQEYMVEVKRTLLQITAWGIVICATAYFSNLSSRIPGLVLGMITSMIYFLLMCYRVEKSADMSVAKAISYMRLGWLMRLSFIALMLILSIKVPIFDFISSVVGLFSLHVVIIGNAGVLIVKNFLTPSK